MTLFKYILSREICMQFAILFLNPLRWILPQNSYHWAELRCMQYEPLMTYVQMNFSTCEKSKWFVAFGDSGMTWLGPAPGILVISIWIFTEIRWFLCRRALRSKWLALVKDALRDGQERARRVEEVYWQKHQAVVQVSPSGKVTDSHGKRLLPTSILLDAQCWKLGMCICVCVHNQKKLKSRTCVCM